MASRALDLAQAISNTTGNGALVFAGSPALITPSANVIFINTISSNSSSVLLNSNIIVSGNLTVNGTIDLPALTTVGLYANAAYTQANTADQRAVTSGVYANSAYLQANAAYNAANNATDTWVRNAANSASSYANSAYEQANTATTNAATADQKAVTSGVYANAAFSRANTATTNAATADQKAVSAGSYANSSYNHANSAFSTANTKYDSSGGTISGDVNITGNLNVVGNTVTHSSNSFVVNDPLILLANNNPGNLLDTGFISHYIEGGVTKHSGLVRDSSANTYYLFDSYVPHLQETNTIDPDEPTLRITTLKSNLISDLVLVRGYDVVDHTNNAYTQANTANQRAVTSGVYANAAFSTANSRVLRSGDAMTGALSTTGNVFAQVLYANTEFYAGVATYSATLLPNALGQFTGNSNTYIQVNQQNIDPQGTSDYVLTADVGDDSSFYVDLGIKNSQYNNLYPNNSLGTSAWPLDGYLVVKGSSIDQLGGNLVIGTTSTEVPTDIKIIVGGINEQNVVARFTTSGVIVNGTAIFNSNSAIKVPTGNTAQRTTGTSGEFRFNQELEQFEGYNGTAWGSIGGGASGSSGNEVFYENDANVTASYTITSGKNAMSAGPIEIQDGVIVTVPDGSVWTIV
jgi:hypothetical protein